MKLIQHKPKGILICCCKEADNLRCKVCDKGKLLAPDRIIQIPTWKRAG